MKEDREFRKNLINTKMTLCCLISVPINIYLFKMLESLITEFSMYSIMVMVAMGILAFVLGASTYAKQEDSNRFLKYNVVALAVLTLVVGTVATSFEYSDYIKFIVVNIIFGCMAYLLLTTLIKKPIHFFSVNIHKQTYLSNMLILFAYQLFINKIPKPYVFILVVAVLTYMSKVTSKFSVDEDIEVEVKDNNDKTVTEE